MNEIADYEIDEDEIDEDELEDDDLEADEVEREKIVETETTVALRAAISGSVDELVQAEAIELVEGGAPQLIEELLLAALEAATSRQLLRKLRGALFRSEHVADVFASDIKIEQTFRAALGG